MKHKDTHVAQEDCVLLEAEMSFTSDARVQCSRHPSYTSVTYVIGIVQNEVRIALRHSLRNERKKRKIHVYYMYIVERDLGLYFKPWLPLTDCTVVRKSPSPWVGVGGGFSFLMFK